MTAPLPDFSPSLADFSTIAMPEGLFDGLINNYGIRLLWLKSLSCPCTQSTGTAGAANPSCETCNGRGIYYRQPGLRFNSLISFQHGPGSPDEPGIRVDSKIGQVQHGEPTLTIPKNGPNYESTVWADAAEFDAYVELDAAQRLSATLKAGVNEILPYQQGVMVESVTVWNSATLSVETLDKSAYQVRSGRVWLNEPYVKGTPYTVSFTALPVYVAFRSAGGLAHSRPFGLGNSGLPKRFRLANLDVWTRATMQGEGSPQAPYYAGSKTPPVTTDTPSTPALQIQGWA
jgi:hypothetical protein